MKLIYQDHLTKRIKIQKKNYRWAEFLHISIPLSKMSINSLVKIPGMVLVTILNKIKYNNRIIRLPQEQTPNSKARVE